MSAVQPTPFLSPRGNVVLMEVREGTNDWNVCQSIIAEDEYRFAPLTLTGCALDVGAHIGAATMVMLVDNPDLRVIAVEPLIENVALLVRNATHNKVVERLQVIQGGAGTGKITLRWNWRGGETERVHRYIGNQFFGPDSDADEMTVQGYDLPYLVELAGGHVSMLKIDCEGCEDAFLVGDALRKVDRIHGEFHFGPKVELRFLTGKEMAQ